MEKVRAGERVAIKAATWNAFVDAANWVKDAQRSSLGKGVKSGVGGGIVSIKNMEESAFSRFSALVITGVCVSPDANEDEFTSCPPAFEGHLMTAAREGMPYAVLLEPVQPGEFARAMLMGITPAMVVFSDSDHAYAVPRAGSETGALESFATGVARVLWKDGGTGSRWCVLQLGGAGGGGSEEEKVAMCRVAGGSAQSGYTVAVYPNGRWNEDGTYSSTLFLSEVALDAELPTGAWVIGHRAMLPATGGDDE